MPQLSLYFNDATLEMLKEDAKRNELSPSRFVSKLVYDNHEKKSAWPEGYWESVIGSITDPTFVAPEDSYEDLDGPLPEFD